ncbi:MAG: hypothetical protein M3245_01845 [Actinomycetota bacterium]|nr:hypothetical protein [Actinomycetota bacterium]
MKSIVRRAHLTFLVVGLVAGGADPSVAGHVPEPGRHPRLYLLSGPVDPTPIYSRTGLLSADPSDPRATLAVLESRSLLTLVGFTHSFAFQQADRYFEPVSGGRFRARLDIQALPAVQPSVRLEVWSGLSRVGEFAATQTSSGVWEGEVPEERLSNGADELMVRLLVYAGSGATVRLHLAGASYFEPRQPIAARTFRDVQQASPPPTETGTLQSRWRSFAFNDGDWTVERFEGRLGPEGDPTDHAFELAREARFLYVWVEIDTGPLVADLAQGRVRPEDRTDMPLLSLLMNGAEVASGANNPFPTNAGSPVDAAAIDHAPPGSYALRVGYKDGSRGSAYTAFALAVYGPRTLASATARFTPRASGDTASVYASPGTWGYSAEPVPFMAPAAMMHVRLGHEGPLAAVQEFDLELADPWGGLRMVDDEAWVAYPAPQGVWTAQQYPSRDAVSVSSNDVVFTVTADYWYDPAPHPA